jgi:RNA polymerase sigma-70 factor, ECF subfamily
VSHPGPVLEPGDTYGHAVRDNRSLPSPAPDFERLVDDLSTDVWRLCRHLGDPQSADDLTQETFLRVYRALPRYRGEASPRTWVLSIARRVCADHVQKAQRDRLGLRRMILEEIAPPHAPDPSDEHSTRGLIDTLEPDRRSAFVLTQLFGMSYAEAAEICECPVGTIRSRVARARTDLIEAMAESPGSAVS